MLRRAMDKLVRWSTRDLANAENSVAVARRWAARSTRNEQDLARVLIRLAKMQAEAGRQADALATLEEVVQIGRRRMVGEPARFEPVLATGLLKQAALRTEIGQWEEALGGARQAVELFQRLLPRDPNRFEPVFAGALNLLGACLAESHRHEEAVAIAEHAVRIGRRLALDNAEAHEPDLAVALHTLGSCLIEAGRLEDGLRATDEAIQIRCRLAERDPGEYEPALANSMRNRDIGLTKLTRRAEEQAGPGEVVLGPYPLCDHCKKINGGLVAVRHRQIHVRANGKEACVDEGLADIMAKLWTVCDTTSCCEDDGGRAYVYPANGHVAAAHQLLTSLGIRVENDRGALYFRLPRASA